MKQVFCLRRSGANPSNGAVRYTSMCSSPSWSASASETGRQNEWLVSGTFRNFVAYVSAAPAGVASWAFAFRKNGVTQVTLTISGTGTFAYDLTSSFTVSPGDLLSIQSTPTGTPTSANPTFAFEFEGDTAAQSGYGYAKLLINSVSAATFSQIFWGPTVWDTVSPLVYATACPIACTLDAMSVTLDASPGSGKSYTFTIYKNGVKQDGSGGTTNTSFTISDSATSGSLPNPITFAAGDLTYVECLPAGTPTQRNAGLASRITAAIDGESIMAGGSSSLLGANTPSFVSPHGFDLISSTESEHSVSGVVRPYGVGNLYVTCEAAPGTCRFTLRKNGANTAITLDTDGVRQVFQYLGPQVDVTAVDLIDFSTTDLGGAAGGAGAFSMRQIVNESDPAYLDTFLDGQKSATGTTQTLSVTVGNFPDRAIYVGISTGLNGVLVSSVTFSGSYTSITELLNNVGGTSTHHMALFRILNPQVGTFDITITYASAVPAIASAIVAYDVDQNTPNGAVAQWDGNATASDLTVVVDKGGERVLGWVEIQDNSSFDVLSGQTETTNELQSTDGNRMVSGQIPAVSSSQPINWETTSVLRAPANGRGVGVGLNKNRDAALDNIAWSGGAIRRKNRPRMFARGTPR